MFALPDIASPKQLLELYDKYLEEIEEDNNKRKIEDEEYEKRKQKLVRTLFVLINGVGDMEISRHNIFQI